MNYVSFGVHAPVHLGYFPDAPNEVFFMSEYGMEGFSITRFEDENMRELSALFNRVKEAANVWKEYPDVSTAITVTGKTMTVTCQLNKITIESKVKGKPIVMIHNHEYKNTPDETSVEFLLDIVNRICLVLSAHRYALLPSLEQIYRDNAGHNPLRLVEIFVGTPKNSHRINDIFMITCDLPGVHKKDNGMLLHFGGFNSRIGAPLKKDEKVLDFFIRSLTTLREKGKYQEMLPLLTDNGHPRLIHLLQGGSMELDNETMYLIGITTSGFWTSQHTHLRVNGEFIDTVVEKFKKIQQYVEKLD